MTLIKIRSENRKMSEIAALKENVKKVIKSLLVASPQGMDERTLNREYSQLEGKRLPVGRLGFSCAEDLLKSFSDILDYQRHNVRIIFTCKKSDEDEHVWRMVREQRNLPTKTTDIVKSGNQGIFVPAEIQSNIMSILLEHGNWMELSLFCQLYKQHLGSLPSIENLGFDSMEMLLKTMTGRICTKYNERGLFYISAEENMTVDKQVSPDPKAGKSMQNVSTKKFEQGLNVSKESSIEHIPTAVIDAMKILAQENKNGIRVELLIPLYKDLTGNNLNVYSYGYSSVIELIQSLSSIFKINTTKNQDYYLTPASGIKKDLSLKAKSRLKCLLNIVTCGVSPPQLFALYKKEFPGCESDLDWIAHGYNSLFELLQQTQTDSILRIKLASKGPLVYPLSPMDGTKPKLPNIVSSKTLSSQNRKSKLIMPSEKKKDKFVLAGESYKKVNIKEAHDEDGWFEILVAEVYSPLFFWAQLRDNNKKLDKLMDQMMEFYIQPEILSKYRISPKELVLERPVVSLYENDRNFYRAIVTNFKGFDTVEVFYVDYGTDAQVDRKKLWFLDRQFFDLPAQAIQARLSGIAPSLPGQRWVHGASKRFLHFVENKPLCAKIHGKKGSACELLLIDTTNEECDVNINERLVLEQFAVYKEESDDVESVDTSASEFRFGVDPNEDPELSSALRLSIQEHHQQNLIEKHQSGTAQGASPATTTANQCTLSIEEEMLQKAIFMSISDKSVSSTAKPSGANFADKSQAFARSGYTLNLAKMSEEEQLDYAMKISMQKCEPLADGMVVEKAAMDLKKEHCKQREEQSFSNGIHGKNTEKHNNTDILSKEMQDTVFTVEQLVQIRDAASSKIPLTSTPTKINEILLKPPVAMKKENSDCVSAQLQDVDMLNTISEYIGQLKKKRNKVILMLIEEPGSYEMLNHVEKINKKIKELKNFKESIQLKNNCN